MTLALLLQALITTIVSVLLILEKVAVGVVLYLLLQRAAEAVWNWWHREPKIPCFIPPVPRQADQLEVIGGGRRGPDPRPDQALSGRFR